MNDAHEGIAALYTTHTPALVRYLTRVTGSVDTAEDIAHDTFVKALHAEEQLDNLHSVSGWLFRVATNAAFDRHRRQRARPTTPLTAYHTDTLIAASGGLNDEEKVLLSIVLDSVPTYYRTPLLLSYAGYSIQDIAVLLGWKLGTVKSRMSRARAHMRQRYRASDLATARQRTL
jgi:RNA polymerase sigma-70 factor (ECF subfamily)